MLLALGTEATFADGACRADRVDERVAVSYVLDGDTVRLQDGRRVRLLGIDAPELGRDGADDAPFAVAARDHLRERLRGAAAGLRYDRTRTDRYGRTLAHLFLAQGTNVQADLLTAGLALARVIPPDDWSWECYGESEAAARREGRGLWSREREHVLESERMPKGVRGFRLVRGEVLDIGENRDSIWLQLAGPLRIRLDRQALGRFEPEPPPVAVGSRVLARGWIYRREGKAHMDISHPAAFTRLD